MRLFFRELFKGYFGNKTLLFQQATSDKFSTNNVLPDHAIKNFFKNPCTWARFGKILVSETAPLLKNSFTAEEGFQAAFGPYASVRSINFLIKRSLGSALRNSCSACWMFSKVTVAKYLFNNFPDKYLGKNWSHWKKFPIK